MGKKTSSNNKIRLICWLIALLTFVIFSKAIICGFTNYDDPVYVTENPHVHAGLCVNSIKWAFSSLYAANWHPVTWLSHMLDWQIYGSKPAGHHFTSLLIHIVNSILLFLLLNKITGRIRCSALVAVLFAIHPLHVESVAWIAERKDVLSTMFCMLTMLAYVQYTKQRLKLLYLCMIAAYVIGLMAKPILVSLPLLLLLLDYWPLARFKDKNISSKSIFAEKVPLVLLAAASCYVTIIAQRSYGALNSFEKVPVNIRIPNAIVSFLIYLRKTIWPNDLAVFYPHPVNTIPVVLVAFSTVFTVCVTIFALAQFKKKPYLTFGWLWYIVSLVPVIGLVQVGGQAMADRYTYLPLIGIFIAVVWGVSDFLQSFTIGHKVMSAIGYSLALLIIAALCGCTWKQVGYWHNSYTLFSHAARITRENAVVDNNLGLALFERKKITQAAELFKRALANSPFDAKAHINLANTYAVQRKFKPAEYELISAIQYDPKEPKTYYNLGNIYSMENKLDKAIRCYSKSLEIDPGFFEAQLNMGNALSLKNRPVEAIEHFNEAININPCSPQVHYAIADAFSSIGRKNEAAQHYYRSLRIHSNSPIVHFHLALVLDDMGNISEAVKHYQIYLKTNPKSPEASNNLAWIFATSSDKNLRNPAEAVRLAEIACKYTQNKRPDFMDTLAAAYASKGDYGKAVSVANTALNTAFSTKQPALAADIRQRQRLYLAQKPYRSDS